MRSTKWLLLTLITCLITPALAAPLDPKQAPADSKWLIHVDMDALVKSNAWQLINDQLQAHPNVIKGIDDVEMLTGLRFPDDVRGVTLFGQSFKPDAPVVMIHAKVDQNRLLNLLTTNPAYGSHKHGDHEVHTWADKGKQMYGAFHNDRTLIGNSRQSIQGALDVLDGKADAMKADAGLAGGAGAGVIAYIAGQGLAELEPAKQANSPLVQQVEMAWVSLGEEAENLLLQGAIQAKTAEVATQIKTAIEGLKAFLTLAGNNQQAPGNPKLTWAAAVLKDLTIKSEGQRVALELRLPLAMVKEVIENRGLPRGPAAPQRAN